jgi:hypothetical protein
MDMIARYVEEECECNMNEKTNFGKHKSQFKIYLLHLSYQVHNNEQVEVTVFE